MGNFIDEGDRRFIFVGHPGRISLGFRNEHFRLPEFLACRVVFVKRDFVQFGTGTAVHFAMSDPVVIFKLNPGGCQKIQKGNFFHLFPAC